MKKFFLLVLLIYLLFPFFAGMLSLGDKMGPVIYFQGYHIVLYQVGYEVVYDEKPRASLEYERPLFYGLQRKPTKLYYEIKKREVEIEKKCRG